MIVLPEDVLKLLLAILIGGLIGAEREYHDRAAGFRTIIFICVGATLFTIFSQKLGGESDAVRIASGIVTGVGFLGAGVILRDAGRIIGLTTASTIWLTAALGMGVGGGYYLFAGLATGIMLIVLWFFPRIERWIDDLRHERTYEVVCAAKSEEMERLTSAFKECGLQVHLQKQIKSGTDVTWTWQVSGSPQSHDRLVQRLLSDAAVREFRF